MEAMLWALTMEAMAWDTEPMAMEAMEAMEDTMGSVRLVTVGVVDMAMEAMAAMASVRLAMEVDMDVAVDMASVKLVEVAGDIMVAMVVDTMDMDMAMATIDFIVKFHVMQIKNKLLKKSR